MASKHAKYGKSYETPTGLQEDNYYEMMYDLMDYVCKKGLTIRQAQKLFVDCFDMVLDVKPMDKINDKISNKSIETNYLESITECLDRIAYHGIMINPSGYYIKNDNN